MQRQSGVKWIAASLVLGAALLGGASPAAAKLPPEAADKPGYLIIGTYLLHKDALNKDNFAAAKKSMDSSGQGMYYKSEFADGTWFDLSGSTELSDISDAKGKKAVPVSRVEQLDLQIWIDEQGQLHNLMNPDVIAKQIEQLKQDIEKLQKDSRTAVEENKQSAVSRLALEQNQREASLAFLEALTAGKPEEAKSMLGRMGDPEAALTDLQRKAAELAGTLGAEQKKLEAQLQEAEKAGDTKLAQELQAKLKEAKMAAGPLGQPQDAAAAAAMVDELKAKQAELKKLAYAAAKSGGSELIAELQTQAAANQAALDAAKQEAQVLLTAELKKKALDLAPQLAKAAVEGIPLWKRSCSHSPFIPRRS
ncbi:hypothetical protein LJK87_11190 [Paenibacillus sp. P25]|nr:hypothetical protein LJK87_11190 [Paenibacillus sp. P25]